MKRIGVLFGQERAFPQALLDRINEVEPDGVVAEAALVGGVKLDSAKRYDLVLDRISQDVPFYRAVLKKLAADGTVVVNNPFWWSADDKFFNNVLARKVGVAVPKTVILPSYQYPPDTTAESFTNLANPLKWDDIFDHIGFPAYLKPYSGGGWKHIYRVATPDEFFATYHQTGQLVMMLQEEIVFERYFRCYVIGRKHVHIMPYDPRRSHFERYLPNRARTDHELRERVRGDCLKLADVLGYDFNTMEFAVRDGTPYAIDFLNPAPDADPDSIGAANFEWVVEHASKWLVERVQEPPSAGERPGWEALLSGSAKADER
jgi:glutathione synthase/RimK-type ligase-like ATP-grasp enzyme